MTYELGWNGVPLTGDVLAFDCETNIVDLQREVPQLVLVTVTDGRRRVVLRAAEMGWFLLSHPHVRRWSAFNARFEYWVIRQDLQEWADFHFESEDNDAHRALALWDSLPVEGKLCDLMLLDFLYRLATGKDQGVSRMRDLGEVSADYLHVRVNKQDPYRKRFGELLEVEDWTTVEQGFFQYAMLDTVVTFDLDRVLQPLVDAELSDRPDIARWGKLTHDLQVRADIVLAAVGRRGFQIDRRLLAEVRTRLSDEVKEQVDRLVVMCPGLFDSYIVKSRAGELKLNKQTGVPKMKMDVLRTRLLNEAETEDLDQRALPKTKKTGAITTSLPAWHELLPESEFVRAWATLADRGKLLQFVVQLEAEKGDAVHSDYNVIVRTGRTSSRRPNIQQMPKEAWFRKLFVPRAGNSLVVADYSAIELVTLSAVLIDRYGKSVLADVIREGRDPHSYTASLVSGHPYDLIKSEVKREKTLPDDAPKPFSALRQSAKAINFGVPGGLGARKLAVYARHNYGVPMTAETAAELRSKLITVVYPELGQYLDEDRAVVLATNLHADVEDVREVLSNGPAYLGAAMEKVVRGQLTTTGREYNPDFVERVWGDLNRLNRNADLAYDLRKQQSGARLARRLFGVSSVTLTGRKRADCSYTEARNTPFQGLAADGAKLALWNLHLSGYQIVAFIHDEVVVEVPTATAEQAAADIAQIMSRSMQAVLYAELPVAVEYKVADCWSK